MVSPIGSSRCSIALRRLKQPGGPAFRDKSYNLGSDDPPPVRTALRDLINEAGSKSILLPTPAPLVKLTLTTLDLINMPLMDPQQYLITDEVCILDTTAAKT